MKAVLVSFVLKFENIDNVDHTQLKSAYELITVIEFGKSNAPASTDKLKRKSLYCSF